LGIRHRARRCATSMRRRGGIARLPSCCRNSPTRRCDPCGTSYRSSRVTSALQPNTQPNPRTQEGAGISYVPEKLAVHAWRHFHQQRRHRVDLCWRVCGYDSVRISHRVQCDPGRSDDGRRTAELVRDQYGGGDDRQIPVPWLTPDRPRRFHPLGRAEGSDPLGYVSGPDGNSGSRRGSGGPAR
jgi:hypothetical protein